MNHNRKLTDVVLWGLVLFLFIMPIIASAETDPVTLCIDKYMKEKNLSYDEAKKLCTANVNPTTVQTAQAQVPAPEQKHPDIVVKEIKCSQGKLTFTVANIGGPMPVGWYSNAAVKFDGVHMGLVKLEYPTYGDLNPSGGVATYVTEFEITKPVKVEVTVDASASIPELNEGNNYMYSPVEPCGAAITTTTAITQDKLPDLVVKEITCGSGNYLLVKVANIGGPISSSGEIIATVNFDGVFKGGFNLGKPTSGDLTPAGGVATYLTNLYIANPAKVEVWLDTSNAIQETNEGNNYMYSPVEPCGGEQIVEKTPLPAVDPVMECITKNQKLKGLSYDEAKKLCTAPVEPPRVGIEGCIEKYMDVFKISYEEAKKRCEGETAVAKTETAVAIDRCGDVEKKLNILVDKLNAAQGIDAEILKKEIEALKIELKSCEAKTSIVQKDVTPGIKNPCDEVKMLKDSIEQLSTKITYIKELIAKGQMNEKDLAAYSNEYNYLNERLEKMNFACQQGKPVEESPCARLSKLEMIYREINDKLQGTKDEKSINDLNEKLASVVREIKTLKQECIGENLKVETTESLYDIEKSYRTKQKAVVESTSEKDMQNELAKIETEKRKLIEEYAQRLQELDARQSTIIKKLEIKGGKIILDDITSKSNKVKINVEDKDVEIEPTGSGAAITHGDIRAEGNVPLEYAGGALISSNSGKEIKILPSQIQGKVKGKVKEIKINDEGSPKYTTRTESGGKLLWFIPATITKTYEISAEDGKIISEKKSWWSFAMAETPEKVET